MEATNYLKKHATPKSDINFKKFLPYYPLEISICCDPFWATIGSRSRIPPSTFSAWLRRTFDEELQKKIEFEIKV